MMRRKLTLAALLGSAFAAAAVGTTLVSAAVDSSEGPAKVQRVDPELSAKFSVLRQETASDTTARQSQEDATMAETGVNPDLGRTGARLGADVSVVSPSKTGLCIGTKSLGILTCGDTANAIEGEVVGSVICSKHVPADKVEVLGAFPDEVTELRAELSDGSTATYPVGSNTFVRQFDKSAPVPLYLSFDANGASQRVRTALPENGDLGCGG